MDKIDSLLEDIRHEIYSETSVQEYFRLRNIIKNDERLSYLDKEIKKHQKGMCNSRKDEETFKKEEELYFANLKEFEANPLIKNYNAVKEDVFSLLYEIEEVLR